MPKLVQRLLIFFIGIPLVIGLVFLPFFHQLPFHIAVCVFSFIGSLELYDMFSKNSPLLPKPLVAILNLLIPVSVYVCVCLSLPLAIVTGVFVAGACILMAYNALTVKSFEHSNTAVSLSVSILLYTGYLITFISRMTAYEHGSFYIAAFLWMTFICDSLAWLFGMLLGKNNRGVVAASPNKSIAGFAGGYVGCILASLIAQKALPHIFPGSLWKSVLFGILVASAAIVGDLAESVFKRSANVKDSGGIMPGRGGVLDSIDSLLFAAPVFYLSLFTLYGLPIFAR
ncbi:phosphatidate cytidylyltransferase [Treponema socranskii]|uniref:phosphatidate cytidylyltransferase n=1 Tax=Treponema socranskii TaxID=53419 RepID=UPI003D92F074